MTPKLILSAVFLFLSGAATTALAQDKIHLKNGSTLEVKVVQVAPRTVTYKKWDNQSGPDYIINKSEVDRIAYQNGEEEEIEDDMDDRRPPMMPRRPHFGSRNSNVKYGNNILAIAPVQMTNESVAGFGLHYERVLDKKSMFSLYVPLAFSLVRDEYNYGYPTNYNTETHMFFNAYPGLKIYPTGSNGMVRYALGPSLAIGAGNKYYTRDVYNSQGQYIRTERVADDVFHMGIMINNSLNVMPTQHLYLGVEFGIGFLYSTTEDNYGYNNVLDPSTPLVQFNFKIGYRF